MERERVNQRVQRINLLKIPLDILGEEDLEEVIRTLAEEKKPHQIVLLNFREFMRSRRDQERLRMLQEAALVLPISRSLIRGARFLKRDIPVRKMPFEFVIRLLGVIEKINGTVYLLGEKNRELNISSGNLRDSFPGLLIVGRHQGYLSPEREKDVVMAIKKTTPTLLLAGSGLKGGDRWIYRRQNELGATFSLWCGECFKIFSGKAQRISRKQWESRAHAFATFIKNPVRLFGIFPRIGFGMLLLIYRIRKL